MLALLLATVGAPQGIQISAEVDRERTNVGDAVTYTVRALVAAGAPIRTQLPSFDGFTLIGRTERREVAAGTAAQSYVLELRLRADRVGAWHLGPVRVIQGSQVALSPEVLVEVMAVAPGRTGQPLGPRVLRLLQHAPRPPPGNVAVALLASGVTVRVGEQLDLVTAAWFPRQLLAQLRRPPSLRPPVVAGVYSAQQPTTAGVGASLRVGGLWYDLYVAHQVVFPLTPGQLEVPQAGLTYSVPSGRQYFSEEQEYQLVSNPLTITITALPPAGTAGGPAGREIRFTYQLSAEPARTGEPIPVVLELAGTGNVALWPAPTPRWPEGTRGYRDRVDERVMTTAGLVSGVKRFRFVLLVDSTGSLALPEVRYPFFDLAANDWREAIARAVVLPVLPGKPVDQQRAPLALLRREPFGLTRFTAGLWWTLAGMAAAPLLLLGIARRPRHARVVPARFTAVEELADRIRHWVPEADRRRPVLLEGALRESGIDGKLSGEAARLYQVMANARFGPEGARDRASVEAEAARVLARLPVRGIGTMLLLLSTVSSGTAVMAQSAAIAAETWDSPMVWFNEGAAAWDAGQDARAAASWLAARRLAPRSPAINAGWLRVSSQSEELQRAGRVFLFTPPEWALVAGLFWVGAGFARVGGRRRVRAGLILASAAAGAAAITLARREAVPIAIVARDAVLRQAPHGLAVPAGRAEALGVVLVVGRVPGWTLVTTGSGGEGWLPEPVLAEVRRLDSRP